MSFDYDLFVIGGGSGGVRAARVAAQTGASVGLAEEYRYGGTCVIRGCVPKKLMVYASQFSEAFEDAKGFGWTVGETSFDWGTFIAAKDKEIDRLEGIYSKNLQAAGVNLYDSRAIVTGPHEVTLASDEVITAKTILVATGGTPFVPDVEGKDLAITSNEIFELKEQPKRVVVVGGGYIACEFACILNGMGSEVTLLYRGEQILRGFDNEVQNFVADEMRNKGVNVVVEADVSKMEKTGDGILVTADNGQTYTVDQVLYATGRNPHSANMGLEDAGVKLGDKGEIIVDAYSCTSVPSIYAVGDVTDRVALTPVAIREGMAFVETVFKNNPTSPDHGLIPTAVFTQPEIGTVGQTEEEAREEGEVDIYSAAFRPMMHVLADRSERMLMKLIVSKASRKVLGCHIVGHGAGEMIQLAGIAVKMGATKEDFDRTVAVHPTAAEELVTMSTPTR
ncbi:glutathione-disulfide reductase [Neptunicoccus sediminis]|uniref:glutathione-disulfide reductase n=1 Tax=Neptunicoccus sediminis TaxID=1892596 RepID=UPI000845F648|nr:glutathione-disulfide reductase [Neptunicoccus sediminis]